MDESTNAAAAPKVTAQVRELAGLGLQLVDHWPVAEIAELYEQLDNVASMADPGGFDAIITAALELTVYLSSLVESGVPANPAQRERVRSLLRRLAVATGAAENGDSGTSPLPRPDGHRVIYYLRPAAGEIPGLVQQFAQEGFVTRSFEGIERAIAEAHTLPAHALVVDESFVPGLMRLIETVERASGEERRRPLALALCHGGDVRRRLFAQRAGADAVLEDAAVLHIVDALMALFLQQSREHSRVLIIEDDVPTALFCAHVLAYKRLRTRTEHSARAGLDAITAFRPDLVLLDLYLPDMNGIEVAQLIRERPDMKLTPIVFMSAEADIDQRFDAIRMGGDDFLSKPIRPRHLLASVTSRVRRLGSATNMPAAVTAVDAHCGRIDRATLVHEIERARRGELGECTGLIMLSVDDVPSVARRLGFVRTGELAHQVGTAIAGDPALNCGVCALGEFSFISLLPALSEPALHIAAENLRARLSGRGWLAADAPMRISFSLGGARADQPDTSIDDLFSRVSDAVRGARARGKGCSDWMQLCTDVSTVKPEVRLARAILRRPLIAETTQFRFRALVPLRGQLANQFLADFALIAPKATRAKRLERALYAPVARSLNVLRALDRWQIHALAGRVCIESARIPELRIVLRLTADSLFDPAFAPWLAADLHGLQCDPDALAFVFDAAELIDHMALVARSLEALQATGVRVFLSGLAEFGREQRRLCGMSGIYGVLVDWEQPDPAWPPARDYLIAESLRNGKIVVVSGVDESRLLGALYRERVHYVVGDAVAGWNERISAPFAAVAEPVAGAQA